MTQATMPFGEWRPDIANWDNEFASEVDNVLPGLNSYKPLQKPVAMSTSKLTDGGNDTFTKVLLQCDGANGSTVFVDSNAGGSAHTWSQGGTATISTANSKF